MQSLLKKHKLAAILLFVVALGLLNITSEGVRGGVSSFLAPFQASLWKGGNATSNLLNGLFAGAKAPQRVLELEAENLGLRQQLLAYNELEKENERLREAFLVAAKEDLELLFAEIIAKEVEGDVLLLNKGTKDGVKEGMPVLTQSKVAVGRVGKVFLNTCQVLLFSLKDHASDVKIQGKETVGVLKGQGRFGALLDLIPQEEELVEGDVVLTSALGGTFPDNFLVGELQGVQKSDLTAFQGGFVKLFFHPRKENSLFILKNYP